MAAPVVLRVEEKVASFFVSTYLIKIFATLLILKKKYYAESFKNNCSASVVLPAHAIAVLVDLGRILMSRNRFFVQSFICSYALSNRSNSRRSYASHRRGFSSGSRHDAELQSRFQSRLCILSNALFVCLGIYLLASLSVCQPRL